MSYPGLIPEHSDIPTGEQNEHAIHKAEGSMFRWCSICKEEELCIPCNGEGEKRGIECVDCEGSGRRLP